MKYSTLSLLAAAVPITRFFRQMGGIGLLALGVVSSILPLPGSLDAVTIVLAARHQELWWYYGLTAMIGSVAGAYVPYSFARSGKRVFGRSLASKQTEVWARRLNSWGFGALVVTGLLPPPLPSTPVLLAAGAVRYSRKRFFAALALGRSIRYFGLALLAAIYGRRAVRLMFRAGKPMLMLCILAVVAYAIVIGCRWLKRRLTNDLPQPEDRQECAESSGRAVPEQLAPQTFLEEEKATRVG